MKKKQKQIVVGIILVALAIFAINQYNPNSLSFSPENNKDSVYNMEVSVGKASDNLLGEPLVITTTKGTYKAGENVIIEDFQPIDASCSISLRANFVLKRGSTILDDHYEVLPVPTAYATMFYKISFPGSQTKYWQEGTYKIDSTWYCDGVKLNTNGLISPTTSVTSTATFNVIVETDPEPEQCPIISSCGSGYVLENPNSADCYCKRLWTPDNGICETGETPSLSPNDCKTTTCQPDEIIIDNVCVDKSIICVEQGGTKNCSDDGGEDDGDGSGTFGLPFSLTYVLIIGGLALILYWAFTRNGKKK